MSWIFCVNSNKPFLKWEIEKFIDTHKTTDHCVITPSLYLAFSAHEKHITIHYENYKRTAGWIVLGTGILFKETGFGFAEKNDWKRLIDGEIHWQDMNGQFLVFKWNDDIIEIWNDTLGFKDIFFTRSQGYSVYSTRLDWLSDYIPQKKWNYKAFGSLLLSGDLILPQVLLKDVHQLGQAGFLKSNQQRFQTGKRKFTLIDEEKTDINQYFFYLNKALMLVPESNQLLLLKEEKSISLRYVLSVLLNKAKNKWSILEPSDTDELNEFLIMQSALNFSSEKNPGHDDYQRLINLWKDYVYSSINMNFPQDLNLIQSASEIKNANYCYQSHYFHKFFVSKEPLSPPRALKKFFENYKIEEYLKSFKTDFSWLREEWLIFFRKGLLQYIEDLNADINKYQLDSNDDKNHYLEIQLKALRKFAPQHNYMSQFINIYSPLLNFALIKMRMNLDLSLDELNHLYHMQIEKNYPELLFYLKFKEKKRLLQDEVLINPYYFNVFKEEIFDTLRSKDCIHSSYYQNKKIDKLISKADSGQLKSQKTLIQCFGFELWRKKLDS